MDTQIVVVFCLCDDMLKALHHHEDIQRQATISVFDDAPWWVACGANAAITRGTTINICIGSYFDSIKPTPVLIHELIHVRQYLETPNYAARYFVEARLRRHGTGRSNVYEKPAYDCADTVSASYGAGGGLPALNTATCNLTLGP